MFNAYYMLVDVRDNVGEATEKRWGDNDLLRKINFSHRMRAIELLLAPGDWLVTSTTLTPSNSIITLPSDCIKPVYLEDDADGWEIPIVGTVRERRLARMPSTSIYVGDVEAYMLKDSIEVNQVNYTKNVKLWYQVRVPDLATGTADAGAATSLTLEAAMEPHLIIDYYNDQYIDIISGTGSVTRDQITDYTAARVCTVTGTYSTDTVYGTVSQLPQEAYSLIVLGATLSALAKPGVSMDPKYFEFFADLYKDALRTWKALISSRVSGRKGTRITEPY